MGNRIERMHVIGTAVLALLIVLVGWFFLISPQRSETTDIQGQVSDAQLQNTTLQTRLAQLAGEQKKRATYAQALAAARAALPTDSDMSTFLRGLQAMGAATGVTVTSVSVGDAEAVAPAPAAAQSPTAAAPATGTPSAPTSGLFKVDITANASGPTSALRAFVDRLQTAQPRAVLVSELTYSGIKDGAAVQLKITAFVAPAGTTAPTAAPSSSGGD